MPVSLPRSEAIKKLTSRSHREGPGKDFWPELSRRIKDAKVIPIISGSFRMEHIFRNLLDTTEVVESNCQSFAGKFLNIDNVLSQAWADDIGYPMPDDCELARVAQYNRVRHAEDDEQAKADYLSFLKSALLSYAESNQAPEDLLTELQRSAAELSFTDLAMSLEYPRFNPGESDPLQILADLPLPIYVTTSCHEFLEKELVRQGKTPLTQVCFWSGKVPKVDPHDEVLKDYLPTVERPLVYHLYGIERYPTSLIISEDDYLDFLTRVTHDLDPENPIIPLYLRSALSTSSLIMLGYRLWEWDFRILFRSIVNTNPNSSHWLSLIIQLNPEQQYQIRNGEEAKKYLETYFNPVHFKVQWNNTECFVCKMWEEWNRWRLGQ